MENRISCKVADDLFLEYARLNGHAQELLKKVAWDSENEQSDCLHGIIDLMMFNEMQFGEKLKEYCQEFDY